MCFDDTNLGAGYDWTAGPNSLGGTLSFESESKILNRTASTTSSWKGGIRFVYLFVNERISLISS